MASRPQLLHCCPRHPCLIALALQVVRAFGTSAEVVVRVYSDPSLQPFHSSDDQLSVCFASAFFVFVCRKTVDEATGREVRPPFPSMFPETQQEITEYAPPPPPICM